MILPALPTGTMVGQYRIDQVIGQGGMATVYRATASNGYPVALKLVGFPVENPESRHDIWQRFEKEVQACLHLQHPNLVRIFEHGSLPMEDTAHPYIVMQLVLGARSLRSAWSARPGDLDWLLAHLESVLQTLQYVHGQNIIHRDLKPENILIDETDHLYLVDFGLARVRREGEKPQTKTGQALGTVHYMALEQLGDAKRVDARADLYSLGVILFELLENVTNWKNVLPNLLCGQGFPFTDATPPVLRAFISRLSAPNVNDRYASATDALAALQGVRGARRRA
ncbi:MAG: serine/threonine-protein kinase [Candidatus Xenobia bacterium]